MLFNEELTALFFLVIIIWLGALTFFVYRSVAHYRQLVKGAKGLDLSTILDGIIGKQNIDKKEIEEIIKRIEKSDKENQLHIQKLGMIRFNPFSETGGNQSFALALLNNEGSGFVISSLHGRDSTRIYAKVIEKGKSIEYDLSKEEKEAVIKASK